MRLSDNCKQKKPQQSGNSSTGQKKKLNNKIKQKGGFVK